MKAKIKALRAEADALEASIKPPRILSIKAKNIQNGDHVNIPIFGWSEVNGVVMYTDTNDVKLVTVASSTIHPFPGDERVQVRRYL